MIFMLRPGVEEFEGAVAAAAVGAIGSATSLTTPALSCRANGFELGLAVGEAVEFSNAYSSDTFR